jgi:hypothetical protein
MPPLNPGINPVKDRGGNVRPLLDLNEDEVEEPLEYRPEGEVEVKPKITPGEKGKWKGKGKQLSRPSAEMLLAS